MTDEVEKNRDNRGKAQPQRLIVVLADRQHGVGSYEQLIARGMGPDSIQYRTTTGLFHRLHQGVFALGRKKLTREGHWMAAVLAYGPNALLSHRSAGALWRIATTRQRKIDVTTPSAKRSRRGIRAHRAQLHPEDIAKHDNIPVTSVARTILDLAALEPEDRLTRIIENAERLGLFDLRAVDRAMERCPRHRGIGRLRAVLADYRDPGDTRSALERDFLALIKKAEFPPPRVNTLLAGELVDIHWPEWGLVIELDSRGFHMNPRVFESDRVRDALLQRHGFRVLRITRKRLDNQPQQVLEDVRALIRPPRE